MSAAPLTFPELSYSKFARLDTRASAKPSLLSQARQGNADAFAEIAMPYMPAVYQRARRLTGSVADAQDVSQEALLKAWSRLEQFAGKPGTSGRQEDSLDDFRAWLGRIAGNTSIDVLRQRRDGKILSLEDPRGSNEETIGSAIPAREQNPEELCARREAGRMLAEAIRQLPPDLRQACLLRDVLQYSSQEAADRLGISVVAVRLRLFRAHRRLREKLEVATHPQRGMERNAASTSVRATRRRQFLPLGAAEFACGD
jgi:RNA polymerase sigma-70 factor (ECF subfamily)